MPSNAMDPSGSRSGGLALLDRRDDRLGGADRVAGLRAAVSVNRVAAGDRRLCVSLDRVFRHLERAAGPVGPERAGLDDQHLDPERSDLLGQRLGQALDREFCGVVVADAGKADEAALRRDIDDRARLLSPHQRQHGAGDRGEAEHVGLEHGADVLVFALFDRRQITVAGVVDEHVDAAEFLLCRLDRRRNFGRLVDVELQRQRVGVMAGDEVGDLGRIARGGGDAVAAPDQDGREFAPEAGRAAGDEPDGFVVGRLGHGDLAKGMWGIALLWHASVGARNPRARY